MNRRLPSDPRCKMCSAPFGPPGGVISRLLRHGQRRDNPLLCNWCYGTLRKQPGGAEVDVSVLFADIVGFTSMSEKMSPAAVALILNDYLSRMTDVIFKYEGTLDKYIGDAIMAVFGAPLDMPDHAYRSIMAALEMQERLTEFNTERKEGPHLRIRIGINSGKAVAGDALRGACLPPLRRRGGGGGAQGHRPRPGLPKDH
jgi:class 3 adenylate cyclase